MLQIYVADLSDIDKSATLTICLQKAHLVAIISQALVRMDYDS